MKYESEILYDLMKRDGLLNPSQDSLPYESELKEKYVDEVKGAYPKVTDYRPEWLNYNLGYYIPADFPTESLVNVTSGTVNNVVPYAFKSAILSGSTKYQIGEFIQDVYAHVQQFKTGYYLGISDGTLIKGENNHKYCEDYIPLPAGVTSITAKGSNNWKKLCCYDSNKNFISGVNGTAGLEDLTFNIPSNAKYFRYSTNASQGENEYINVVSNTGLLLASSNYNIPCELISCKMPVLKTTGKNLLNPSLLTETPNVVVDGGNATINIVKDKREWSWVKIYDNLNLPVGNYYILCEVIDGTYIGGNIGIWDNNLELKEFGISNGINLFSFNNCSISKLGLWQPAGNNNCKLRLSIYTNSNRSYEPYKSNILTVNEEVELRGVGDVQDTLDLMTGEVVQNIYEFTLDGSQNIDNDGDLLYYYLPFGVHNNKSISDKLPSITVGQILDGLTGIAPQNRGNSSRFYIKVNGITTKEEMKNFFLNNPTTIQLILATPTIKTVDLTSVNQDGVPSTFRPFEGTMHIQTDGTPIKPTFSGEIPVEAITQNLASFVDLEGVERNE